MKHPRELKQNESVKVYRNLHTGKISVIGLNEHGYHSVIAHVDNITLRQAKLCVNERGRQRVLREKQKNVHAYIRGKVVSFNTSGEDAPHKITYNPYKYNSFVRVGTEEPVIWLNSVTIRANGVVSTFQGE